MQAREEPESLKQARLRSNFQTSMMAFGDYLPTDSELDRLIFKLLAFVKNTMLFFINDGAVQDSPEAQYACRHGLTQGQLRYFFHSYPDINEKRRMKYAFVDELRDNFTKYAIDDDQRIFRKYCEELPRGKLNKHLNRLKSRKVIQHEGLYYSPAGLALVKNALPYQYKRIIRRVPIDLMISNDKADAYALLIYPDRKKPKSKTGRKKYHPDLDSLEEVKEINRKMKEEKIRCEYEAEIFELVATFENDLRELYGKYYAKRLKALETKIKESQPGEEQYKLRNEFMELSTSTQPIIIMAPFQQPSWPCHVKKGRRKRRKNPD